MGADPSRSRTRKGGGLAGAGAALLAAACQGPSVLNPKGPVAAQENTILLNSLAVMLVIVVPTIVAALVFAWWFRASNGKARYQPDFVYSGGIELVVWSIPVLTIAFLGGLIWIGSYRLDPHRPLPSTTPPLEVQVVSLDWKWLFIYPGQGVATVNELVVPAGRPVRFDITSASVMNVFFVPQLGSQIYAMNGMVTRLNLQADAPGTYYGQSAHFSGDGFPDMHFQVRALPPAQFARWTQVAKGSGRALDRAAYAELAKQSRGAPVMAFGAVEPGLFQAVASRRLPPGPGPDEGRGGPGIKPVGGT